MSQNTTEIPSNQPRRTGYSNLPIQKIPQTDEANSK
ncbi:hypothetical protein CCACVL1_19528, partial [Corchorus capsularis]